MVNRDTARQIVVTYAIVINAVAMRKILKKYDKA
jgi:hypothetical protein